MKKKIIAKLNNEGKLGFSEILEDKEWYQSPIRERLDQEIARYVGYIHKNNYGFNKTQRDHYGRKHIPKTVLKLEQLLYIKYGIKIEVEI